MQPLLDRAPLLGLVLARVGGLLVIAPIFSSALISAKIKVFLTLMVSLMLAGVLAPPRAAFSAPDWAGHAAAEFTIGLLLGSAMRLAYAAVSVAGEVMGLQMGLGVAALYDPNSEQSGSILEQYQSMVFATLFITLDGHHHILRTFQESYVALPLERPGVLTVPLETLARQGSQMLSCGFRLAAPVVLPLLVLTLAVALTSRACPQMNIWSLSYGLSIMAGLVLLSMTAPGAAQAVREMFREMDRNAAAVLRGITGHG